MRVVFDTKLRLPAQRRASCRRRARCRPGSFARPTRRVAPRSSSSSAGVEVLRAPPSAEGRIDPSPALRLLASRGIVAVDDRGRRRARRQRARRRLVDELHAFIAPILLGPRGRPGRRRLGRPGHARRGAARSSTRSGRSAGWTRTSGDRCVTRNRSARDGRTRTARAGRRKCAGRGTGELEDGPPPGGSAED